MALTVVSRCPFGHRTPTLIVAVVSVCYLGKDGSLICPLFVWSCGRQIASLACRMKQYMFTNLSEGAGKQASGLMNRGFFFRERQRPHSPWPAARGRWDGLPTRREGKQGAFASVGLACQADLLHFSSSHIDSNVVGSDGHAFPRRADLQIKASVDMRDHIVW